MTHPAKSLPTQGAWIEMSPFHVRVVLTSSLPTQGAWIEIQDSKTARTIKSSRSLHRERGLKYDGMMIIVDEAQVAPYTGSVD